MPDEIVQIVLAVIAGGGIKHFLDYLIKRKELSKKFGGDPFRKMFQEVSQIYTSLSQIAFHCKAQRVLIVKVENGGDIPSSASTLHSSVLYEMFEQPLTSLKTDWQKVEVGEVYIKYVKEIYENESNVKLVRDIPHSELKDLHTEHNTKKIMNYFLLRTQKYFMYLSVQFADEDMELNAVARNSIRINKEQLIKTISKIK